jgi:hypothetical protein
MPEVYSEGTYFPNNASKATRVIERYAYIRGYV